MRACLAEIHKQQERSDLTPEQQLDEFDRITRRLIQLHQEWSELLDHMSSNHKDASTRSWLNSGRNTTGARVNHPFC
jgi:hypothetical protein